MNEEKKAELKTDLTDLRHAALDLAHEAMAERSAEFDARLQAAWEQAAIDEMERRTNPPRVVAEDVTTRSVFDDQPGTRVDGAFGRGTLSPDGNVLSLDFPQSQLSNLQPGNAPKVTPADIEAEIASEHYFTAMNGVSGANEAKAIDGQVDFDTKAPDALDLLTFCVLVLRNGFTVTGESACASPTNFDAAVGRRVARAAAVAKMWTLLGFSLRNELTGHRPMATRPVLDTSKLPERLESPSWQTSPAPVPVVAVERAPVVIEFNVVDNPDDFGYLVVAHGRRGDLNYIEREPVNRTMPSHTEEDDRRRHITEAKRRAAERVQKWFDTHQDDDRQQDA